MKRLLLLLSAFLFSLTLTHADSVSWLSKFDEAKAQAEAQGKNIFALITAPSWCIWCTRLEENVLSKPEFQDYLNDNYIPLKVLDKIDGKRNPELDNFDFSGYPSVFLFDGKGRFIQNIYTQDPVEMLASMAKYRESQGKFKPKLDDLILPEKYTFTADGGGEYINNGDGSWTLKAGGEEVSYKQARYDFDYIYLEQVVESHVVALPMKGTDRHIAHLVDGKWTWSDLADVQRVGGDPYFD